MVLEFFGNILGLFINSIIQIISYSGYAGIFFLMTLESAVMPVPSEIVMPFSGYLVSQGRFDLWLVTLVASVGNLFGSVIAYLVGMVIGRKAILKYGKYILLNKHHVLLAEKWFKKHGDKTIFISRLLPVVRTVMPLPAGIARMNFPKFVLYSFVGSIPWNLGLAYVGVWFGQNWLLFEKYAKWFDVIILIGIIGFVVWFILKRRNNNRK